MLEIPIRIDITPDPPTAALLERMGMAQVAIANHLLRLTQAVSASRFTYQITFDFKEKPMPHVFKSDEPNFDFRLKIRALDSEGNVIEDAPIPAGFTLTVTSDNTACFAVTQDAADPRLVHAVVGGPNPDSTPSQANVMGNLTDASSNLVATGSDLETVTVGDPATIQSIGFVFPQDTTTP